MANRERGRPYASILIPAEDRWNPLEHITAQEYIPPVWIGAHAGLRLVEAFKTLATIPVANGPRFQSGYWAPYPMEAIDIVAKEYEYLNDYGQAREAAQQWARTRHRATPEEVSRMEAALSWPARYLHTRPLVCRLTLAVAQLRSVGFENEKIARRLRMDPARLRRTNRVGLDTIATGLRRDAVAVF